MRRVPPERAVSLPRGEEPGGAEPAGDEDASGLQRGRAHAGPAVEHRLSLFPAVLVRQIDVHAVGDRPAVADPDRAADDRDAPAGARDRGVLDTAGQALLEHARATRERIEELARDGG